MNKQPPLQKNQDLDLTIESLTGEGQGVARVEGYAVFVTGALPGERVRAHVIKVTGSYAVAKCIEVLSPSPDRVVPKCPVFDRCGGCALQHLACPAQLLTKQQQVTDALTRLGGFPNPPVKPVVGMEEPWRYRNKASFPFGSVGGGAVFGFFAERSHRLIPFSDCPIQDVRTVELADRVTAWANENRIPPYDEITGEGVLRHVMARVSTTGETMTVVVTKGPLKKADALIAALDGVDSVYHNRNDKSTNVIFGPDFTLLSGKQVISDVIGDSRFSVSPRSFLQVNPVQTRILYETALDLLSPEPDETVVDAYCGIGTISLMLAGRCAKVIGIEQVADAIRDAKQNAAENAVSNASFLCGNVEEILPNLLKETPDIRSLVLDPPRKGCEESALAAIGNSAITRVAYVSCNPATLARDAKILAGYGFQLKTVQPVDMFPQTGHVESVVLMSRKDK